MNSKKPQLLIFSILLVALLAVGYWHIFLHQNGHVQSAAHASSPSDNDTQVDTQGDANAIVTYRPDLSTDKAVFNIDLTSDTLDLTTYNYKSNLVLTDTNFTPLPYRTITAHSIKKSELKAEFITSKFPGNHFHFDVRNLGGIEDRVLHFYRTL